MGHSIIQRLHDSEINGEVYWLYDSVFRVRLGCPLGGRVDAEAELGSWDEVEEWLKRKATELYPESEFARGARQLVRRIALAGDGQNRAARGRLQGQGERAPQLVSRD